MQPLTDAVAKEDQSLPIARLISGLLEAFTEAKKQSEDGILSAQEASTLPPLTSTPAPASEEPIVSHCLHASCSAFVCG